VSNAVDTQVATHTFRTWIKATPEQVWDALTSPATLARYGYGGIVESDFRAGSSWLVKPSPAMLQYGPAPEIMLDGEILEAQAPSRPRPSPTSSRRARTASRS
jgi:uncharacterized protein YndB with AHSA1/START domain